MLKATVSVAAAVAMMAGLAAPAMAAKHARSCDDLAWESQEMKDCRANPDMQKHQPHHGTKHHTHGKHMKGTDHGGDMKKS
jgi:hypothetical protein